MILYGMDTKKYICYNSDISCIGVKSEAIFYRWIIYLQKLSTNKTYVNKGSNTQGDEREGETIAFSV